MSSPKTLTEDDEGGGSNTHNHAHWKLTYALLFSCTEKMCQLGQYHHLFLLCLHITTEKLHYVCFCDVI